MAKATTSGYADLLRAVFARLNRAPLTTDYGCEVYDGAVPAEATPPIVRVDVIPGEPWDTFTRAGHQHVIEVHIFSTSAGSQQAQIVDAVVGLLDATAPAVVGQWIYSIVRQAHREADDEVIGGVRTSHRIAPFRVYMAEGEHP